MRIIIPILATTILTLPFLVSAQTSYTPLVQVFGTTTAGASSGSWQQYIDLLYATAISLAALLAVIKIVIAGAKYMFSDVITNKSDAKKDIQGALLGLLLIVAAVIVLELINPRLSNVQINIPRAASPTPIPVGAAGAGVAPAPAAPAAPTPAAPAPTPAPAVPLPGNGEPAPAAPAPVSTTYTGSCAVNTSSQSGIYTVSRWDLSTCPTSPVATNLDNMTPSAYYRKQAQDYCRSQKGFLTSVSGKPGVYECKTRS